MTSNVAEMREQIRQLKREIEDLTLQAQHYLTVINASLTLMRRMGLPEDVNQAIQTIQRIITTVRMLHTAITALNAVMMGAGGYTGIAMGLISMGGAIMTSINMVVEG